jgi:hypothetical protein
MTLGDDAIPDLVAALSVLDAGDREALLARLWLRRDDLEAEGRTTGPLSWNLARERAREALADLPRT